MFGANAESDHAARYEDYYHREAATGSDECRGSERAARHVALGAQLVRRVASSLLNVSSSTADRRRTVNSNFINLHHLRVGLGLQSLPFNPHAPCVLGSAEFSMQRCLEALRSLRDVSSV